MQTWVPSLTFPLLAQPPSRAGHLPIPLTPKTGHPRLNVGARGEEQEKNDLSSWTGGVGVKAGQRAQTHKRSSPAMCTAGVRGGWGWRGLQLLSLSGWAMGRADSNNIGPAGGLTVASPQSSLSAGCAVAREPASDPAPAVAGRIIRKI